MTKINFNNVSSDLIKLADRLQEMYLKKEYDVAQ